MPAPSTLPPFLDLDRVVVLLREQHHIENAYVEQTGGGVAAIYAGPTRTDDEGQTRYAAIAGPGQYGWGIKASVAYLEEFYVGPDDQGEGDPVEPVTLGATSEEHVATIIAAQARKSDPTVGLSADEIDRLGFDSTGRSLPPELVVARQEAHVRTEASNAKNQELIAAGHPYDDARRAMCEAAGEAAVEAWRRTR
jgi:hypothetical protein